MNWQIRTPGRSPFPIESQDVVIGSGERCQIVLPDAEKRHAMLRLVAGRWLLESIDDAPLWVNERSQSKAFLNATDTFRVSAKGAPLVFEVATVPTVAVAAATTAPLSPPSGFNTSTSLEATPSRYIRTMRPLVPIIGVALFTIPLLVTALWLTARSRPPKSIESEGDSHRGQRHEMADAEKTREPERHSTEAVSPPVIERKRDPLDFLVLIGIASTDPSVGEPAMTGIGWLFDRRTVSVSRELGLFLEGVVRELQKNNDASQYLCVIQGQRLRVGNIKHPAECPKISQLSLSADAELSSRIEISPMSPTEFEKRRQREKFHYYSYIELPRTKAIKPPLIGPYDGDTTRMAKGVPTIIYEKPDHALKSAEFVDDTGRHSMERGGLIADVHDRVVGFCLSDSTIVWGSELSSLTAR